MEKEIKKYIKINNIETDDYELDYKDLDEDNLDERQDYSNYSKNLISLVGYLLGVKEEILLNNEKFNSDEYYKYDSNYKCKIIRMLSIIRMNFLLSMGKINAGLKDLIVLEQMDFIDKDAIKYLRSKDIEVVKVNCSAQIILSYVNQYIHDYIDDIKDLIPDWVKWDYIRRLFIMNDCMSGKNGEYLKNKSSSAKIINSIKKSKQIYILKRNFYPYGVYMYWPTYKMKSYYGNILFNDEKFLKLVYTANDETFRGSNYVTDASDFKKESIYDFIDESLNVSIFVDCENVDPYRFAAVLLGLDETKIKKIKKIILYNDNNTTNAWNMLGGVVDVLVEQNMIERVLENKSLVDVTMTAGVCKAFYNDMTESIILASSDSDFWGVISALPKARFYVLNESDKTSEAILETFSKNNIKSCFMDEFSLDKAQQFKNNVLISNLNLVIAEFNDSGFFQFDGPKDLVDYLFDVSGITLDFTQKAKEKEKFIDKYLKYGFNIKPIKDSSGEVVYKMEYIKSK